MGKEENVGLLFPKCFLQFNTLSHNPNLIILTNLRKKSCENIVGKGENAGIQHFLLFPHYFLPFPNQVSISDSQLYLSSAITLNLVQSKILSFGNGLRQVQMFEPHSICHLHMLSIWTSLKFCSLAKGKHR